MKYSDLLADWLKSMGYTHCFYVAGGNIMHLLASVSEKMHCIPVVHEVAAGIATEYFNEVSKQGKAFALVTAGPGLTNIITAMAGAYLESRELLVLGGQVKTADLSHGKLRQRGIQEIAGVDIAGPIAVRSQLVEQIINQAEFAELVLAGSTGRKGPVFIELPLDVQGRKIEDPTSLSMVSNMHACAMRIPGQDVIVDLVEDIRTASRPVLLLGGGISRQTAESVRTRLAESGVAVMTTWNAADRIGAEHPYYFGRPNTWGQRYSNLLLQQADLIIALGTRLGLQQTGFNWREFAPVGRVVQVDCDASELNKEHPRLYKAICGDANEVLQKLLAQSLGEHSAWTRYCADVKRVLPLVETCNKTDPDYLSPYGLVEYLSSACRTNDVIIPCSSGSAFTVMMQTFSQKTGQLIVTNKGLASMGYGLSGAIGAAFAHIDRRVVLVEGDGGFAQNLQELGTVAVNKLNLKIFLFDDNGYASIRMTQRNYFGGRYVGCDVSTGLGLPNWTKLFAAYDIPIMDLRPGFEQDEAFMKSFESEGPAGFLVKVDPEQTYFPKIMSRVTASGSMESNPLHHMSPPLDLELARQVMRYLPEDG